jgi:alpha-glucosidase (family GH31 glycosyl hydrolase)
MQFGRRFVVAPVQVYQAKSRSVYLPALGAGERWVHFYTREPAAGGARHTVATTNLTQFPLFERVPS